ncbi:MAG: flagellar motor switch protein FliN [Planctomycetota bacterium]|jgi:flagellar motor switch protein FliN|nr:flagellar motor switch protein FliN [Planctomycetota bacterium]MDA1027200.1 flagellar motor switch protein FliN [Planctomycetota bacterium]
MTDSDPRPNPTPSLEIDPGVVADAAIRDANAQVEQMTETAQSAVSVPLPDFDDGLANPAASGIGMLGDVDLDVRIELGRTSMLVDDVLKLAPGCVVELDKAAGDPVDIFVNGRHVARGEVLVLNENFCVRVSEIVGGMPESTIS